MAQADAEDTPPNRVWVLLGDYIALAGEELVRDGLNKGRSCRYRDAWGNLHSGKSLPGGFWLDCVINRDEHSAKRRERVVRTNPDPLAASFAERYRAIDWRQALYGQKAAAPPQLPPARDRVIPALEIFCVELLVPLAKEKPVVEPAVPTEAAPVTESPKPVKAAAGSNPSKKKKRSRRKTIYHPAQRARARVVLRRMYPDGNYPPPDKVSNTDLYDRFCVEYGRVEGKEKPPSKHGCPSLETVLREVGRKD